MRAEIDMERESELHNRMKEYAKDKGVMHSRAYRELLEIALDEEGY